MYLSITGNLTGMNPEQTLICCVCLFAGALQAQVSVTIKVSALYTHCGD